jgi:hypothetical protein
MLDAGHVVWVGAVQVAAGVDLLVQRHERARCRHFGQQVRVFFFRPVAPDHAGGLAQRGALGDPAVQQRVRGGGNGGRDNTCHGSSFGGLRDKVP